MSYGTAGRFVWAGSHLTRNSGHKGTGRDSESAGWREQAAAGRCFETSAGAAGVLVGQSTDLRPEGVICLQSALQMVQSSSHGRQSKKSCQ